jgi:hypothetical protein
MLVAKISPSASFSQKDENPFSSATVASFDHLGVIGVNYVPGNEKHEFVVVYGNIKNVNDVDYLQRAPQRTQLVLTAAEVANWGTNDEELFEIVAAKLGTSVVEFKEVSNNLNVL